MVCLACESFAAIAPRISGGLSTISSGLIIYIIFKSESKLRTVYHRIMLGMSCADIISSVAVGLSTLPMPRDLPYDPPITFVGTRLGNIHTCEAQGFCYIFGFVAMFNYNGMLCVYNACAIAFRMPEESIVKRVEPFLHIIPIISGLAAAILPLVLNLYNPVGWDAWCSIATIGGGETPPDDPDYFNARNIINIDLMVVILSISFLVFVFTLFVVIIIRIKQIDKALNRDSFLGQSSTTVRRRRVHTSHENTKIVLGQAIAYFASFCATLGLLLIRAVIEEPLWLMRLSFVLAPLQGLFNMLIFVYYKIFNYRRVHPEVSRCKTLGLLLMEGSAEDYVVFSRISQLVYDQNNTAIRSVRIEDEKGGENIVLERVEGSEQGEQLFSYKEGSFGKHDQDLSGFVFSGGEEGGGLMSLGTPPSEQQQEASDEFNNNDMSWTGVSWQVSSTASPEQEEGTNINLQRMVEQQQDEEKSSLDHQASNNGDDGLLSFAGSAANSFLGNVSSIFSYGQSTTQRSN